MTDTSSPSAMLERAVELASHGTPLTVEQAMELHGACTTDELADAADRVRLARCGNDLDTCSIVNARSGRCSEDCKWCAQSARHHTGCEEYDMVSDADAFRVLDAVAATGVRRYSLVTGGRRVSRGDIGRFCELISRCSARRPGMKMCVSMGLLDEDSLRQLHKAGVSRYHCNLETSSDYFPSLCTTHTHADKLATIAAARRAGMEVCSGGIIGMGESMRQRLELVCEAREAGAVSVPLNILTPIPGTPLADTPLLSEDEVVRTGALMRFVAPDVVIRFAGGRARMSEKAVERMLRGGVNGAMIGDLLTTAGADSHADMTMFHRLGYTL